MIFRKVPYECCGSLCKTGRSQEEKDNFWEAVWKLIEGIKKTERIMLRGDLNGYVGKESYGYEVKQPYDGKEGGKDME